MKFMNTKKKNKTSQIQITNEEYSTLLNLFEYERDCALEFFNDQVKKVKQSKNISEHFEYIELFMYQYNLYNNIYKSFTEIGKNTNDKIITIKEKI
jgi:hypothetical protein